MGPRTGAGAWSLPPKTPHEGPLDDVSPVGPVPVSTGTRSRTTSARMGAPPRTRMGRLEAQPRPAPRTTARAARKDGHTREIPGDVVPLGCHARRTDLAGQRRQLYGKHGVWGGDYVSGAVTLTGDMHCESYTGASAITVGRILGTRSIVPAIRSTDPTPASRTAPPSVITGSTSRRRECTSPRVRRSTSREACGLTRAWNCTITDGTFTANTKYGGYVTTSTTRALPSSDRMGTTRSRMAVRSWLFSC